MKKRFTALFLALMILPGLFPIHSMAAGGGRGTADTSYLVEAAADSAAIAHRAGPSSMARLDRKTISSSAPPSAVTDWRSFGSDAGKTIPVTLADAGTAWDGSARAPTLSDGVCQISEASELFWFALEIKSGNSNLHAILTDDINLNHKTWSSIGDYSNQYSGVFDGNGQTVSGLSGVGGLFDYIGPGGTVKRLTVMGAVSGSGNIGGIAGTNYGSIVDCAFSGSIQNSASSMTSTGGIAGRSPSGSRISGCANSGAVSSGATLYTGTGLNLGGIVGYTYGTVEDCYNTGAVSSAAAAYAKQVGGIAGAAYSGAVLENVYNTGLVTGGVELGAVAGKIEGTTVNVYYLTDSCSAPYGAGSGADEGKSADEMKTDLFALSLRGAGTAFHNDTGSINSGYPVLAWQGGSAPQVSTAQEDVQADKSALLLKDRGETVLSPGPDGVYQIQEGLTLALDAAGARGASITWQSSDSAAINAATGAITLPDYGVSTVTLTAVIAKEHASDTKVFILVISSQAAQNQAYLDEIQARFDGQVHTLQPLQLCDLDMNALLCRTLSRDMGYEVWWPDENQRGDSKISVEFQDPGTKVSGQEAVDYISPSGVITYYFPENLSASLGMNYALYRNATYRLSRGEQYVDVQVQVKIGWDQYKVMALLGEGIKNLSWDDIRGENPSGSTIGTAQEGQGWDRETVSEPIVFELSLPTRIASIGWATIQWESGSRALSIQATGKTDAQGYAVYTAYLDRPLKGQEDVEVLLTAWMHTNLNSSYEDGYYGRTFDASKDFVLTIAASGEEHSAEILAALEQYPSLLRDSVDETKAVNPSAVTADLQMPIPSALETAGIFPSRDTQKVTMLSANPEVLDFYGYHAYVYRPLPGKGDQTVDYTIIISHRYSGAELARKTFSLTVTAMTQLEIEEAAAFMAKAASEESYWNGIKGANTGKNNVTANLIPFVEICKGDNGEPVYIRGAINRSFGGVGVDDHPDYDPYQNDSFREFRSSRPAIVTHENLLVTPPEYNTQVTIDSVLTYAEFSKYWVKFGGQDEAYAQFEQFYKQPISTSVTVKGSTGTSNPNPDPDRIRATVSIAGRGAFQSASQSFADLSPYTSTAWSAVSRLLSQKGYSYKGSGSYLLAITDPNGNQLSELQYGQSSGWMYKVNGAFPETGMTSYYLRDGDVIELFYTSDYSAEPGISSGGGNSDQKLADKVIVLIRAIGYVTKDSGNAIQKAREAYHKLTDKQKALVTNYSILTTAEAAYAKLGKAPLFEDVREDDWFYQAVISLCESGLMNGVSDNQFDPNGGMTRAMLVTILYRMEGEPEPAAGQGFADVPLGQWYTNGVTWALEQQIVSGYGNGLFGVNDTVTREQTAAILMRYTAFKNLNVTARSSLSEFTDLDDSSDWAIDALQWAKAEDLLTGTAEDTMEPAQTASRAQIATILTRYLDWAA